MISPDSHLAYLPWAWIATPEGAVDLALVPSAGTFAWLRRDPRGRGSRVLGVGAPNYDHVPATTLTESQLDSLALRGGPVTRGAPGRLPRFKPLEHARAEVESIAPGEENVRLLGAEASEDGLWAALASRGERHRWRSVHFAVHGYVDPENPANAFLALTPSLEEDGLLTVAEVMGRQVPADIVVLSACSTGRGEFVRGEGLMGLTRAFLFAGAPRVVASLWPVSDAGTARLMALLYERLDQGLDAARALRQAQAALRAENPDPAGWAAWVLWGLPEGPGPALEKPR
jgi:CHAT domain-containing protein